MFDRGFPLLALTAAAACSVMACTTPAPTAPGGGTTVAAALPRLDGTTWTCVELVGADGRPREVTDRPPTLLIGADGRASGFAGVNRYFADATLGNTITAVTPLRFGPVGATRMAGPPERMALEDAFVAMLGSVRSATVVAEARGPLMTLSDERGACARFVRSHAGAE